MYSRKLLHAWFASSSSHHPQARESGGTQLKSPGTCRSIIILSFGLLSLTKIRTITITGVSSLGTRCLNEVLQQIVEKTKTYVWKYLYLITINLQETQSNRSEFTPRCSPPAPSKRSHQSPGHVSPFCPANPLLDSSVAGPTEPPAAVPASGAARRPVPVEEP